MSENLTKDSQEEEKLPDPKTLFLEVPLYEEYDLNKLSYEDVIAFESFEGSIDAYCIDCTRESVFWTQKVDKLKEPDGGILWQATFDEHKKEQRSFHFMLTCSRNKQHLMVFYFKVHSDKLIKVVQFPSIADLQADDSEKYRKVLSKERFKDFRRGIGLASHGVGIGSFVYLRRIFEDLIEEAHENALQNAKWVNVNEDVYKANGVRVIEKIELLRDYLPDYLVQNRKLYGILSRGIHSLSEKDCLEYYPAIKMGIELILDEKLEQIYKAEKIAKNQKDLQRIIQNQTE